MIRFRLTPIIAYPLAEAWTFLQLASWKVRVTGLILLHESGQVPLHTQLVAIFPAAKLAS